MAVIVHGFHHETQKHFPIFHSTPFVFLITQSPTMWSFSYLHDTEDYLRYAHGLISEYISEDLSKALLTHLQYVQIFNTLTLQSLLVLSCGADAFHICFLFCSTVYQSSQAQRRQSHLPRFVCVCDVSEVCVAYCLTAAVETTKHVFSSPPPLCMCLIWLILKWWEKFHHPQSVFVLLTLVMI